MNTNRIAAGLLSCLLLALLAWSLLVGAGDLHTCIILGIGIVPGVLYTVSGRLPAWLVDHSGGTITDGDDPSNLPPRV